MKITPSYGFVNMAIPGTAENSLSRRNKAWSCWADVGPGNGAKKSQQ